MRRVFVPVRLLTDTLPPPCRFLVDYWQGLRAVRLLPRRSEIDPTRMVPILSALHILEAHAPDDVRFRLVGTNHVRLLGFEPTGKNLIELTPIEQRLTRAWRLWSLVERPCAAWLAIPVAFASGRHGLAQSIMLPLEPDRDGAPRQLISVTTLSDPEGWGGPLKEPMVGLSVEFAFLDIGAGVPDGIEPPAGWAARVDSGSRGF
jgi:hypothetical protein